MKHICEHPVRFGHVDPAGVVYYPRFFHYYHCAFEDFFAAASGVSYPDWTQRHHVGFPAVHLEADFAAPLRYGETARIEVTVPRLGTRSVDFHFAIVATGSDTPLAWSRETKVCVDMRTFEPCDIPDSLRGVLQRYTETD